MKTWLDYPSKDPNFRLAVRVHNLITRDKLPQVDDPLWVVLGSKVIWHDKEGSRQSFTIDELLQQD